MSEHKYKITYKIEHHEEGLTANEIKMLQRGGCDSVILISQIYPPDGSYSQVVFSKDGRTGEKVTPIDLWKAWTLLGKRLAELEGLDKGRKEFCNITWEAVCDGFLKNKR